MKLEISGLPRDVQRPFEQLLGSLLDTGGRRAGVRFGSAVVLNGNDAVTATHGLGVAPVTVLASHGAVIDAVNVNTFDATLAAPVGADTTVYWLVIG